MRFLFAFYFLACGYQLFGQYDHFDYELGYDSYKRVYSSLVEEQINGRIKELKKYSSSIIYLHIELNRNNEIIKKYEYADTLQLLRITKYTNQKIVKETEYRGGIPSNQILYRYDKLGHLASKEYLAKKKLTTKITYQYDSAGRLLVRNFNNKWGFDQFVYEGDTVIWKLFFNESSVLTGVMKKIRRDKDELIISHVLDTTSDAHFTQRIKPTREYLKKWDNNENIIESSEFKYDTAGNKILRSFRINEFNSNKLTKSISNYDTDLLKGEFITEFFYNDQGLLELEVSKRGNRFKEKKYAYDERGNCIVQGGLTYRFLYDRNGNWTTKQRFNKKNSSMTEIKRGVSKTKKYTEDSWTTEEKREIIYFD